MNIPRCAGTIAAIFLTMALLAPLARAQEMNEGTRITFSEPVRIPGRLLPPGSYIFERANHGNAPDLDRIQIYNGDHTQLIATIQTAPTERKDMTGGTMLTFAEGSNGEAPALVSWFYPGMRDGHQFMYPSKIERRLEGSTHEYMILNNQGAKIVPDASGD